MNLPKAHVAGPAVEFHTPASVQAALLHAVQAHAHGAFVFEQPGGKRTSISFKEMLFSARRILSGLRANGCVPGSKVILDASLPQQFVPALWATLLGGMVAVPLVCNPWNPRSWVEFNARLLRVVSLLGNATVVSDQPHHFAVEGMQCLGFAELAQCHPADRITETSAAHPSVLISTSGTTGHTQLVTLSGRALIHRWWPQGPGSHNPRRFLQWMPMDHVMGLGLAAPSSELRVHLSPELFVQAPERWLDAVGQHQITHAGMSNFGMALIAGLENRHSCRLSSLQRVGVGTEPISSATCERFLNRLALGGAARNILILGYGLTECGPVAGGSREFSPNATTGHEAPAIDTPTAGHEIRIVSDHGQICSEGQKGLIEVRGPTLMTGYHGDVNATQSAFTADGWLRTGDMGCLIKGCLTVTGREKDVLIVNGLKYGCADVDATLSCLPAVAYAHVFELPVGASRRPAVVYGVVEGTVDRHQVEADIRKTVADRFGFGLLACKEHPQEKLPRTRTGKVIRADIATCLPETANGQLIEAVAMPQQSDDVLSSIANILAAHLGGVRPGPDDDFFDMGGDSLAALMCAAAIEKTLGVDFPPALFTQAPTPRGIASSLHQHTIRTPKLILVPVRTQTSATHNVFLAPGIWGNVGYATSVAEEIETDCSVWTFHLPAQKRADLLMPSIKAFASECIGLMQRVQPQGPYHLAGHSFAGHIAFEMADQLREKGERVDSLTLVDAEARLEQRDFDVRRKSRGGTLLDHHRLLSQLHVPRRVDCVVTYVRAVDSAYLPMSDETGGWSYLAARGVRVIDLRGDHHSIVQGAAARQVGAVIAEGIRHGVNPTHASVVIADDARACIDNARWHAIAGNAAAEAAELHKAITIAPDAPYWVKLRLAWAQADTGDVPAAFVSYEAAVACDPFPLTSHFRFRRILAEHEQPPAILEAIRVARSTRVSTVAVARLRGTLCGLFGDRARAEQSIRLGLNLVPDSPELIGFLIEFLIFDQRQEEARQVLQNAAKRPSLNDLICSNLGKTALQLGRADLARVFFNQALAINPDDLESLIGLAQIGPRNAETAELHDRIRILRAQQQIDFDTKPTP